MYFLGRRLALGDDRRLEGGIERHDVTFVQAGTDGDGDVALQS